MSKIKVRFRVRKKYCFDGDKYRTRTLSVSDDIVPDFPKLVTTLEEMIKKEFPDDGIKLMWLQVVKQKEKK